jgi:hypothetical protein
MSRSFVESLESRTLFAGVTLITHGRDGHIYGFNQAVADDITKRLGGPAQAPEYLLKLTPDATDGHLIPTVTHIDGTGTPQSSSSGEIILLIDWTSIDANADYQLPYIAGVITSVMNSNAVGGVRLSELPIRGISISRGTGLLDEIAKSLGRQGVWVDQETYCDPNPVEVMGDASPTIYDNVAFVDNYWRWDGNPDNTSTNGSPVNGAYNLNVWWLDSQYTGWSMAHVVPGGYYVGTIDTTTNWGGEGPIYPDWYGNTPDKPARDQTGFIYTSMVGAARPLSGVWSASGGTGARTPAGQSGSQWANVTDMKVTSGTAFTSGQTIQLSYLRGDRDSGANVTFYLDADQNPYNGSFAKTLGSTSFTSSSSPTSAQASGATDGVTTGSYYVCAAVTDNAGHTRYAYSKRVACIGPTTYLSDLTPIGTPTNGWGPYERDHSNGEANANDGRTITLNGVTYSKGLGVHAQSDLSFDLNKQFDQFVSDIGVDDEQGTAGSVVFQVFLDGTKVYDSGVMTGSSATKSVSLNVTGATTMRLIVTDAGNGNTSDHGDWAGAKLLMNSAPPPPPPPTQGTTYLSGLVPTSATNGWGPYEKDLSNGETGAGDGHVLTLNGQTYSKGLGVHANSDLIFNIAGGNYTQFQANVGIDDEVGNRGSVVFQVYLDGVKAYDSGIATGIGATRSINLDVSGKSTLRLVVTDAGNGNAFDHADWANARLLSTTPTGVAPAAPTALVGTYNSSTKMVDLSWTDTANDQTGFRVERKLGAAGAYAAVATLPATMFSFSDPGPFTAGSSYVYRVIATNAVGDSSPSNEQTVNIPATSTLSYLSDMTFAAPAINGWGPPERDRSNGETGAVDGNLITLNGVKYTKGLGVHALSDLSFALNGQYTQFLTDVGIDDEKGSAGSVVFQVYGDGTKLYDSGVMTGASVTKTVTLNIAGVQTLRLVVTDAGNGNDSDHGDWAGARVVM